MKKIITTCLVALIIGGCSYAKIKNTIGGPNGLTYSKTETTAPIKNKEITIKKIDGKIVIVNKDKQENK